MSVLREVIRSILLEAAISAQQLPPTVVLIELPISYGARFFLIDSVAMTSDPESVETALLGGITIEEGQRGLWFVGAVWAQHGYGPLMYDIAMQHVTAQGGALGRNLAATSDEAMAVWKRYDTRRDVTKHHDADSNRTFYQQSGNVAAELLSRGKALFGSRVKEIGQLARDVTVYRAG